MNREEEFKKQLRELLESKSFPFEEKDWMAAKSFIDEKRGKRRRRPFILLFSAIALGTLSLLFWPADKTKPSLTETKSPDLEMVPEKAVAQQISSATAAERNTVQAMPLNAEASPALAKSDKPAPNPWAQKAPSSQIPEAKETLLEPANATASAFNPPSGKALSAAPTLVAAELPVSEPEPSALLEPSAPQRTTALAASEAKQDSLIDAAPEALVAPEKLLATAKPVVDSLTPAAAAEVTHAPDYKKKLLISAEAGFNLLSGWSSPNGREGRGINPILGLNYHGQLFEKLECSAGFHFTTVFGLGAFSDTSKVTRFGFGEESEVTVITPKTLLYLHFPLRMLWNFNLKQSAGLNLAPGYLVNSLSQVEQYVQNMGRGESQYSRETGYTQGFAGFDLQLGFFYRQRVFDRFYLQPELFIGLRDLKDNGFFQSTVTERSSGLKLTLLYTLLRR